MGTIQHTALIVTAPSDFPSTGEQSYIEVAHRIACELYATIDKQQLVSSIVQGINGYATFLIGPDGSKEGWPDSDKSDQIRALFRDRLRSEVRRADWVEVSYGELGIGIDEHWRGRGAYVDA